MKNGYKLKLLDEVNRRFEILREKYDILQEIPDAFFKSGVIMKSETSRMFGHNFYGVLFELNDTEKKLIERFESEYHSMVYHVIKNETEIGTLYSLLYVSKYIDEWEMDREDLIEGCPLIYCINTSDEFCSEFGTIAIKGSNGGLRRLY